jgi:type IV secretory pathway TrbD component
MPATIPAEYCARFRPSANRRHLWGGAEPKLLLSCFYVGWMIVLAFENRYGLLIAIAAVLFLRALARQMAKIDPYFTEVYQESFRYEKSFYTRWRQEPARRLVLANKDRSCFSKRKQNRKRKA